MLLLGLLMAESQHGYSINEFIERNLGRVSGMKRATAYALLEKLERDGLVKMETETVGNYPPRKVYSLTPAGREAFYHLLPALLVDIERDPSAVDIALMFSDWLEPGQVAALLQERVRRLQARVSELRSTPGHKDAPGVNYAMDRRRALLQAEQDWILQLITRLEAQIKERAAREHTPSPKFGGDRD